MVTILYIGTRYVAIIDMVIQISNISSSVMVSFVPHKVESHTYNRYKRREMTLPICGY